MLSLSDAAMAIGGSCSLAASDRQIVSVTTDSRQVGQGDLFVALRGECHDGHDFLAQAAYQGACAALVDTDVRETDSLPLLRCVDTRLALGLLASAWRRRWKGPLVAITGNSGKTTVKEMLAHLLTRDMSVHATRGNLNNDIGAPLTLLGLEAHHQAAVIELGANHLGEIAWTTAMARPEVAVITNVTGAHLGEFGGMAQIAQAKAEIIDGLDEKGTLVLNHDDRYQPFWRCRAGQREVITYGFDPNADLQAAKVSCDALGRHGFTPVWRGQALPRVQLGLAGRHNVANALAASAAALALSDSSAGAIARLEGFDGVPGRLQVLDGPSGGRLLDDSYNANPGAVMAAMDTLMTFAGPHWVALGAMGELGVESARLHADVGHYAQALGVEMLLTVGDEAQPASQAFVGGRHFESLDALIDTLSKALPEGATLLIKGSRCARMERVVAALKQ